MKSFISLFDVRAVVDRLMVNGSVMGMDQARPNPDNKIFDICSEFTEILTSLNIFLGKSHDVL